MVRITRNTKCTDAFSLEQMHLHCDYCKRVNDPLNQTRRKRKNSPTDARFSCQPWWLDTFGDAHTRTLQTLRMHQSARKVLNMPLDLVLEETFTYPST